MSDAITEPPKRQRWYLHADSKVYGPYDQATIAGMIARNQMLPDDRVHIEGGSVWIDAHRELILGPLFQRHRSPFAEPPARKARRRFAWVRFVPAALLPLIIGWIAWPYFAVFSLMNAVQNGDIPTLERRVDWTSVRQVLRGDLNAHLLQNLTGKKGDTSDAMGTGFAALLGPAVINNLIDGYVTPHAIAALARNEGKAGPSNDDKASSNNVKKAVSQVRRLHWEQVKYAFFSGNPLSFEVDLLPPNDPPLKAPINLVFNWSGDWRLVRIMLPSDVLDTSSRTVAKQDTPPKSQQGKIAEPPPVELTLLSKRFREANFRATPAIQTAIEFELSIINKTQQQIRAFDGVLTFTDLLDNELLQSKLAINDLIGAGSSVHWSGEINFNEFMDSHRRLRNADIQNVKIKFSPRKLLYANGSTKEFN